MEAPRVVSSPEDFTLEQSTIALPRLNADGRELVVCIRALPLAVIAKEFSGLPSQKTEAQRAIEATAKEGLGVDATPAEPVLTESQARERTKRIIQGGTVAPAVAFDPGEAGVQWDALHYDNQQAWLTAILAQSGLAPKGDAAALLTFRVLERGGVSVS